MKKIKLIIFDFDGVLNDSLLAHLKFLGDIYEMYKNLFNLNFMIPKTKRAGRKIVDTPMSSFIRKAGFRNKKLVKLILLRYNKGFANDYSTRMFKGVDKMLDSLKQAGFVLAIASSNVLENIRWVLGPYSNYFKHVLALDNFEGSKARKIKEILSRESMLSEQAIFVGDMETDYEAAKRAGIHFVGAKYGWGNFPTERSFLICRTVKDLKRFLLSLKQED